MEKLIIYRLIVNYCSRNIDLNYKYNIIADIIFVLNLIALYSILYYLLKDTGW